MTGLSDKVKFVTVDIRKGENTSAEYRKINRFGKVPFLKWGDFKLAETLSIMVFLCEAFGLSDWLPNRTREFLRERARVENVLDWLLSELLTNIESLLFFKGSNPSSGPQKKIGTLRAAAERLVFFCHYLSHGTRNGKWK